MAVGGVSRKKLKKCDRKKFKAAKQENLLKSEPHKHLSLVTRQGYSIRQQKQVSSPPLCSSEDRWTISHDCFLSAAALSAFLHIQVCMDGMYCLSSQRGTRGDRVFCTSLSPPKQITKRCILSTDPYDNTGDAAFEW